MIYDLSKICTKARYSNGNIINLRKNYNFISNNFRITLLFSAFIHFHSWLKTQFKILFHTFLSIVLFSSVYEDDADAVKQIMTIHKRRKRVSSSDIDMTAYNHNVLNFKVNPLFCCTKNIFVYLMGKIFSRLNDSSIIFFAIKFHNSINNNLCFNPFSRFNENAERIINKTSKSFI